MSHTHLLYQLQTLDSQIDAARQELTTVEAALGESDSLKQARQAVETATQRMRQAQTSLKDLELEVKSLTDKIANQEKLLYSGKGMSAKEAANLQDEVTSLKKWQATREEVLLEAMVEAEEAELHLADMEEILSRVEAEWREDQKALVAKKAALEAKIEELQQQRPTVTAAIDADALGDYEDTRRKRAGVAVTSVKDSVCQSCGMIASNNKVRQAQSGSGLVYCSGCGRILYIL